MPCRLARRTGLLEQKLFWKPSPIHRLFPACSAPTRRRCFPQVECFPPGRLLHAGGRGDRRRNLTFTGLSAYQTEEHSKKYPDTAFADPRFKRFTFRTPLIVPKDKLEQAMDAVYRLCEYLEEQRREILRQLRLRQGHQPERATP